MLLLEFIGESDPAKKEFRSSSLSSEVYISLVLDELLDFWNDDLLHGLNHLECFFCADVTHSLQILQTHQLLNWRH